MAQQKGMKRAQKVLARKQKKAVLATKATVRRAERLVEVAAKEEAAAAKKK
jgi:hypothetical protein